ncbi:MAG: DHH family phosphoesterase [Bacteroidales bacterium]|nr:DHH family phosphoesterase [Bacteroidales bacterium]
MLKPILSSQQKEQIQLWLDKCQRFVLCAHVSPDGDAVGSTLGMAGWLRALGKEASIILPTQMPDFLQWIPGVSDIIIYEHNAEKAKQLIEDAEVIACLDFNDLSRLEEMGEVLSNAKADFWMVDHHLNPKDFCKVTVSFPEMSSTSELVFRLISEMGGYPFITFEMAEAIYCGMCTDTGGFTYNSTNPEIYYIIAQLLEKGIDKDKIYRSVYNNYSPNRVRLMGYVMYEKLQVIENFNACIFTITRAEQRRFRFMKGDAEGLVNIPLTIKGTRLSISLREDTDKDRILVSLRSVDDFPCNKMAEEFFNGGGHLNASGGKLYCTMEEAIETAKRAIFHYEKLLVAKK